MYPTPIFKVHIVSYQEVHIYLVQINFCFAHLSVLIKESKVTCIWAVTMAISEFDSFQQIVKQHFSENVEKGYLYLKIKLSSDI